MTILLQDTVLAPRQATNITSTIPCCIRHCQQTGHIDAFRLDWTPESGKPAPHVYWDSDLAKVMEGMAYVVQQTGNPEMRAKLDELVNLVVSAQQPDGYLNTHFTVTEQDQRFKNLRYAHELYCAGHLMEAAVAHFRATGSRVFLEAMIRYADYICDYFGEKGCQGYPGHEELELALVKLYHATGDSKYLKQAKLFIDRRGTTPNYFQVEEKRDYRLDNVQADKPVREQEGAVGHAVRAVYLYSGMADVAQETGDDELLAVCERMFDDIASRKSYLTGGIGSGSEFEEFTSPYDLPPEKSYAESCAAIGLALFCSRMLRLKDDSKYADLMERAIYNGILVGIGVSGDKFFYVNRLEVNRHSWFPTHGRMERQTWFSCSCCPTNFCRFLPQLGDFCYRTGNGELHVDIPVAAEIEADGQRFRITSGYPYDGKVTIECVTGGDTAIAVRIPGWCRKWSCDVQADVTQVYWRKKRVWQAGEKITFQFDMPVEAVFSRPPVNMGRAAVCRGPLVYCLELPQDSSSSPQDYRISLPLNAELSQADGLPEGTVAIRLTAERMTHPQTQLYSSEQPQYESCPIELIPYALWQNRAPSYMTVFLPWR
ncbi:MAG: glycoside hydrolase family 127 protein [Victivallales bacterium]|nr:glycoside hydrolase family 127 protein [Victivallales bacterium]